MKKKEGEKPTLINSNHIAVQSNRFIEARYKESLTFWESFLITKMCSMIAPEDVDFKPYKIYIKEVIDFMELPLGGQVYNYIMDAAKRLLDRKIIIGAVDEQGRKEIIETHIVTSVRRLLEPKQDGNMYVTLTFLPELKPFLLQLHRDFTKLDMQIFKQLKTASSIRLYQIFKSHIGKNQYKIEFDLEELKEILGVSEKYVQYAGFKMRVLDEAQRRLSGKTDISFTYEELKEGKKVKTLVFHINNNKLATKEPTLKKGIEPITLKPKGSDKDEENLVLELTPIAVKQFGVSLKVFMGLVETHTEGEIRQAIEVTQKAIQARKVDNAAGFFVEALRGKYSDPKQKKKQIEGEQKAKLAEVKRVEAATEKQVKDQKQALYEQEIKIFTQLIEEDSSFIQTLIDKVRSGMFASYYKTDITFEENLKHPLLKATFLNVAKEEKPQLFGL
ncbi:MAG: replication initiation protein [Saprospiraceae bacterium]|nr:replication initiation protein [Saprospiraceae bacterium]